LKEGGIMTKKIVQTEKAPQAIGPYSQAIRAGDFLFLSGQIPLDPQTGDLDGEDIETQTKRILENLKAIVESEGLTLNNIVKTTVYLSDMNNFSRFNTIYGQYFQTNPPARATVEVARLPKDVLIEIEATAIIA
jgi:2-iminobutanoate/2-iminopropanoate deaminase